MARLKKLSRRGTWEAAVFDVPGDLAARLPIDQIVLVGERRSGLLRASEPLVADTDPSEILIRSCRAEHAPPGRPKTLRCPPSQLDEFQAAADAVGAKLVPDTGLDLLIDAFEHLMQQFLTTIGGGPDPDFEERVMPFTRTDVWKPVLERLAGCGAWEWIDESVVFEVTHPECGTWFGLMLGAADEVRGLSFYPSLDDVEVMGEGPEHPAFHEVEAMNVHLDPIDEIPSAHRVWCENAGLVFDGRVPLVFDFADSMLTPIDDSVSEDLAAMVEAVVKLIENRGPALMEGTPLVSVPTAQGDIEVAALADPLGDDDWLDPPAERFVTDPHLLFFEVDQSSEASNRTPTRVCLKLAKKDAERLAERVQSIATLEVVLYEDEMTLFLLEERGIRWELVTIVRSDLEQLPPIDQVFGHEQVPLVVMKGGAKRRSHSPRDVLLEHLVHVDLEEESG